MLVSMPAAPPPPALSHPFPASMGAHLAVTQLSGLLVGTTRTPFLFHGHPHSDSRPPRLPPAI